MTRHEKENPSSAEAEDTSRRRNRRQALALGGAAAAAAAVAALGVNGGKKAHAAGGKPLKIGQPNVADPDTGTSLAGDNFAGGPPVFAVLNASGAAIVGTGAGIGVIGLSNGPSPSIMGRGSDLGGTGVVGSGIGDAPGVKAQSGTPGGPGGPPWLDGGVALEVDGKVRFATAGRATVPAGETSSATISMPSINSANSVVLLTPQGDPGGRSFWPEWAGGSFTVKMSASDSSDLEFGYLVMDSPPPVPPG